MTLSMIILICVSAYPFVSGHPTQITCTGQPLAAGTPPQPAGTPAGTPTDTLPSLPPSSESGNTNSTGMPQANTPKSL